MAWDITKAWDSGDINTRPTNCSAIIDKDRDGTPYILAPIAHGVRCFDPEGNTEWSYSGITNGYDVREIVVGDLTGSGYNDCAIVVAGFNSSTSTGFVAILDRTGTALQLLTQSSFAATVGQVWGAAIDGTDIYLSMDVGVTKFVKSGSTWAEDSTNWNKSLSGGRQIEIHDMGNGKRIYFVRGGIAGSNSGVYCFQTDGTQDWVYTTGNQYTTTFAIGKSDSSKSGLQMAIPNQNGVQIIDKDGNLSQNFTASGSNVRGGVAFYDVDNDGEDEIYFSDMGRDVFCIERTGTNTYGVKYSLLDEINASQQATAALYDINEDGIKEIFIPTTDGHCLIYDPTLTTELKDLNIGHGAAGGHFQSNQYVGARGINFADTNGDGHADLIISGGTGYVDVFEVSGIEAAGENYEEEYEDSTTISEAIELNAQYIREFAPPPPSQFLTAFR